VTAELIELAYETDDAWLAALEGIEPDMTPSHVPEFGRRDLRKRVELLRRDAQGYTRLVIAALERLAGRTIG
jgi:hypothetical protein